MRDALRLAILRVVVVVGATALVTCHQAILTAPPGSTVDIQANPRAIPSNGGVAIITAVVIEPAGTPVPDGTVVQFSTTLGRIDEQGRTNDGVAQVKLVADARSGTADVTATSGGESVSTRVTIGNANVADILLRAEPSRITNSNSAQVIATVFDQSGNPLPNVPVYFFIDTGCDPSAAPSPRPSPTPSPSPSPTPTPSPSPSPTPSPSPSPSASPIQASPAPVTTPFGSDFMESSGSPIYTNNNGEARDVLRTRRDTSGLACVGVRVPSGDGQGFTEANPPLAIPVIR